MNLVKFQQNAVQDAPGSTACQRFDVYKDGIKSFTIGPLGLLVLTLAMFFDVLFLPGDAVLSNAKTDLASQFVHWRGFGFGEIARGNLPLWNPHIYSGAPFLAGFQSALLYPLNVLYLVLPLAKGHQLGHRAARLSRGAFLLSLGPQAGPAPAGLLPGGGRVHLLRAATSCTSMRGTCQTSAP